MNMFNRACAAIALSLALSPTVFADPPADKGPQGQSQAQSQGQSNGKNDAKNQYDNRYDDKNKGASNQGQIVSECNHRANERNLKGHDRKEWTEWCEDRGSHHNYDYQRYSSERNCYQKADNKGLSGDNRRKFINECLRK